MRTLNSTIRCLFETPHECIGGVRNNYNEEDRTELKKYLEIPISQNTFELPALAIGAFLQMVDNKEDNVEALVVQLVTDNKVPENKTLDAIMRQVLFSSYPHAKLVLIKTPYAGQPRKYYVSRGLITDDQFNPMMICTWQVVKIDTYNPCHYKFTRPVLYINPQCFIHQEDAVQRFISKKLPATALGLGLQLNYCRERIGRAPAIAVKVIIDEMPFSLVESDTPSISTTSQELLQLANEYLEELMP